MKKKDMALKLEVGDWVLYEGGEESELDSAFQKVWLGQVCPKAAWGGLGIKQRTRAGTETENGLLFGKGAVKINIQWYEILQDGDDNSNFLKYQINKQIGASVQHHRYLLLIGFDMVQLQGEGTVATIERSHRSRGDAEDEIDEQENEWRKSEASRVWLLDKSVRTLAFQRCEE